MSNPTTVCLRNRMAIEDTPLVGDESNVRTPTVMKIATGSLLPASNSRVCFRLPFRTRLRARSRLNTAAASVDETIAPRRRPSSQERFRKKWAKAPVARPVTMVPTTEREIPSGNMGLTLLHEVRRPPSKMMKTKQALPIANAGLGAFGGRRRAYRHRIRAFFHCFT